MPKRRGHMLHLLLPLLVMTLFITGCPKRPATTAAAAPPQADGTGRARPRAGPGGRRARDAGPPAPRPRPRPPRPPRRRRPPRLRAPSEFAENPNLKDVYFDFDKYDVRADDARVLDGNATWLKSNANNLVLIEGHCDERGTNEYNLALGERRAKSTMNYLVSQGIQANRITIISYGKERPVCNEKSEACWQKNAAPTSS